MDNIIELSDLKEIKGDLAKINQDLIDAANADEELRKKTIEFFMFIGQGRDLGVSDQDMMTAQNGETPKFDLLTFSLRLKQLQVRVGALIEEIEQVIEKPDKGNYKSGWMLLLKRLNRP